MSEHDTRDGSAAAESACRRTSGSRPAGSPAGCRACATHPWRVVLVVGIIALLVALVASVGGSLKDKFEIPGSDTQKATDLIESEFASEQGGVLNLVFAAPAGARLDTPARKAASRRRCAPEDASGSRQTKDRAGIESVGDPFSKDTFAKNRRIAYAEAQFDRVIRQGPRRRSSPSRTRSGMPSRRPVSRPSSTAMPSSRRSSRAPRSCSASSRR